jgi:hypothetical protein
MVKTIYYKGETYPKFQEEGNAAQFAIPFAKHVCKGRGYDIGCNKLDWSFPGSMPIDPALDPKYHAMNLPYVNVDYIFSSHCLEHVDRWVDVLDYWYTCLKSGGVLFLYLPDMSQVYWRPWHNRKHIHVFTPEIIYNYLYDKGYKNIFISGRDLNNSFMVFCEK